MREGLGKIIAGTDVCIDNIKNRKVRLVVMATDASDKTKKNIAYICKENDTKYVICSNIENLSKAMGYNNKAIYGIKDKNFGAEIYKIITGGEDLWGK